MPLDPVVVPVRLAGQEYDILVQPHLLRGVGQRVRGRFGRRKVGLISDSTVAPIHAPTVARSLREAGLEVIEAILPAGEASKTLPTLLPVYDALLSAGVERGTPLLALGGGVVGDMCGFVAATLLRGVPFVQIPTTLLSMVDASVGGKTGVDHPVGKNLIGAFHQPHAVLIDPTVLGTLPPRELRGGLAECIKHEIIRDAEGFADLERNIGRALKLEMDYLTRLIAHNVAIKARVVENDPLEKAERAHLNFGHTFAHAIERVSQYGCSHGEAVALGMVAAARLAVELQMLDTSAAGRITALVAAAGLPIGGMALDAEAVASAMIYDKKVQRGRVRFVLPTRIGQVTIRDDVPPELVLQAVRSIVQ